MSKMERRVIEIYNSDKQIIDVFVDLILSQQFVRAVFDNEKVAPYNNEEEIVYDALQ